MTCIMLDLETLGTKPGCKILQIGAVMEHGPEFEILVSAKGQEMLHTCPKTLTWWASQPEDLRRKMHSGTATLQEALNSFNQWIAENRKPSGLKVWGNGADFDKPIIEAAMSAAKITPLWSFTGGRCFRTIKNLFPVDAPENTLQHDALIDAKHQMQVLRLISKQYNLPKLLH